MLRILVYLGLLGIGVIAGLRDPLVAVICCLETYLLNPGVFVDFDLRFQLISTISLIASYLLNRPQHLRRVGREGSLITALWLFVLIGALSSVWAEVSSEDAINTITEVAKTVLFVSLVVRIVVSEEKISWLILASVIGVCHGALLHTLGVRLGYVPASVTKLENGMFPDMHGSVMVLFLPTIVLLAIMGGKFERIFCRLGLPFVLSSIVTTNQRTYFLSMVLESALVLMAIPRRYTIRLLLVLAVLAGLFVFRLTSEDYWQRMSTIMDPTREGSANGRIVLRSVSMRMLMDYPLGVGYRNYPAVSPRYLPQEALSEGRRSAHNSFFTIACETGFLGFAIWAYAFGGAIWLLRRIRKSGRRKSFGRTVLLATGLEIGLYGWVCGGLTQSDHDVDPAYWFIAFAVVLTRLHYVESKREPAHD